MGFGKTIFIILIVYYSIRFITRVLLPFLVKFLFKRMGRKMQNSQRPQAPHQKEGHVSVEKGTAPKSKPSSVVGEYVDFEEVDE